MCGPTQLNIAPTEVKFEFFKSSFFVVAVFLWPNRVVIRINMHQEATRSPTWTLGGGNRIKVQKYIIKFPNIYEKYFYLSILLNSNKKTSSVTIDLN